MGVASVTVGRRRLMVTLALLAVAVPALAQYPLAEGLELERYDSASRTIHADGDVHVLRIDPAHWSLDVFTTGAEDRARLRLDQWGEAHGLEAAINRALALDSSVINKLANQQGDIFHIESVQPEIDVYLQIQEQVDALF